MDEQLEILKLVTARLHEATIPYMVSGSIATSYYAQPRMTRDIDVIVDIGPKDVDRMVALFEHDFYCDREALRKAVETRRLVNLIHSATLVKVDLIVRKDTDYRRTEFARRQAHEVAGSTIWLTSPEDLLLSKLAWARASDSELQLRDARNLTSSVPDLDWPYIRQWAGELSIRDLVDDLAP